MKQPLQGAPQREPVSKTTNKRGVKIASLFRYIPFEPLHS